MAEHPFKPLEPAVLPGNEHALREFTEFFRQEAMNPPKVNELFKIPEGLSPEWQRIFVSKYASGKLHYRAENEVFQRRSPAELEVTWCAFG